MTSRSFALTLQVALAIMVGASTPRPPAHLVPATLSEGDAADWFWSKRASAAPGPGVLNHMDLALAKARAMAPGTARPRLTTTSNDWVPIGPRPIASGAVNEFSGRVLAIATHPTIASTMYVGAALGGVWKTTDAGATWSMMLGDFAYAAIPSIDIDPVDPRIVYAAVAARGTQSAKWFQSIDAGQNWTQLPLPIRPSPTFANSNIPISVTRIAVDPATAGTANSTSVYILGATDTNQLVRVDSAGRGDRVLLSGGSMRDFLVDRSRPSRIFVLRRDSDGFCPNACLSLYRTDDGGERWTRIAIVGASGGDYTKIAQSRSAPGTLIVGLIDRTIGRVRIFLSRNAGDTWQEVASPEATVTGQWPLTVGIHPDSENTFYSGNVGLYRSTDGGATWGSQSATHADNTVVTFDANKQLISGNDGGIFRRSDAGVWTSLNRTLDITQAYAVAAHPTSALSFATGTQDTGTAQFVGPLGWRNLTGGDGGFVAFDKSAALTTYAETQWFNGSYSFYRCQGGSCLTKTAGIVKDDSAPFIPAFTLDEGTPGRVWLGAERLYRTEDRGDSWASSSPTVRGATHRYGNVTRTETYFTAIAVAPTDSGVVYAGTNSGGMRVTTDHGANWIVRDSGLALGYVESIAVDPTNANVAWAVQSGTNTSGLSGGPSLHVFVTRDQGRTWTSITGDLPDIPVNAIILDPDTTPRQLYIGTDIGVFRAADGSSPSWTYFNSGMPPVIVNQLAYVRATGTLVAATYGRGIWAISPRLSR